MNKKNLLAIIILLLLNLKTGFTQTPTTIYTPKGSAVPDTYLIPEFTSAQITGANSYVAVNYPGATRLTNASATYNCHGYAWHISEGGNNVWIGYNTVTAEDIYWNDASYMQVCNPVYPSKVSYASDNHSAITTNQVDIYKSKWGQLPVMQHQKNYTPYNSSILKYYIRTPQITGPDNFCTTSTYNIANLSAGTTVIWSATGGMGISGSATGSSVSIVSNGFSNGILKATITSACGSTLVSKAVSAGTLSAPVFMYINGNPAYSASLPRFSEHVFSIDPVPGATSYYWSVGAGAMLSSGQGTNQINVIITGSTGKSLSFAVQPVNNCGNGSGLELHGIVSGGGYEESEWYSVYPNPAGNELRITSTKEPFAREENSDAANIVFTINLLDEGGRILRQAKSANGENSIVVDTRTIPNGTYFLHIINSKEVIKKQVIIQH